MKLTSSGEWKLTIYFRGVDQGMGVKCPPGFCFTNAAMYAPDGGWEFCYSKKFNSRSAAVAEAMALKLQGIEVGGIEYVSNSLRRKKRSSGPKPERQSFNNSRAEAVEASKWRNYRRGWNGA